MTRRGLFVHDGIGAVGEGDGERVMRRRVDAVVPYHEAVDGLDVEHRTVTSR